MATIGATDYPTYGLFASQMGHLKVLAGGNGAAYRGTDLTENDIILHGMERVHAAIWTYSEAPGTDIQVLLDLSTDGQVTITDAAVDGKKGTILIIGQ